MNGSELPPAAVTVLGQAGSAYPHLVAARLGDVHWRVRAAAAVALGELGPTARPYSDKLVFALRDESATVRKLAVQALGRLEVADGESCRQSIGEVDVGFHG